jgi:hypothetical protein
MISRNIQKGATVWHEALGFGVFHSLTVNSDFANIVFDDGRHTIHRKRLTEIEDKEPE